MDIKCKYYVLTSQHVSYCKLYNMLPISQLRLSTEEGGEQSDLELECVGEERRRVVGGLLSYTRYYLSLAACTRMQSGPPACGPPSHAQQFRQLNISRQAFC